MKTDTRPHQPSMFEVESGGLEPREVRARALIDAPESHRANLKRVRESIATTVRAFLSVRIGKEFHADELRKFVAAHHPTAPASADRILRDLRQRGELSYTLLSRCESRYRVNWISGG